MEPELDATDAPSGGALVSLLWDEDDEAHERAGHGLEVLGHGKVVYLRHGPFVAPESIIGPADVASLAIAARDERRCCASLPEVIVVAPGDPQPFDPDLFEDDPVVIEIGEDYVHACFELLVTQRAADADDYATWLAAAVEPHGCEIASVQLTDQYGQVPEELDWPVEHPEWRDEHLATERTRPRIVIVHVAPTKAMTVSSLLTAGREARVLLEALRGGPISSNGVIHVLRARLPQLLRGLPESEWLEVKSQPYDLGAPGDAAKIELAQDVARFANGEVDAVLVVGFTTTKSSGIEQIDSVKPAKLKALPVDRYRAVIDSRIFPTIEGLTVEQIDMGNERGLLMIVVPAQPQEYKPFLVHGAIVGDKVEGSFISIVRRRSEGSVTVNASQVHAMLAAGRALLRGDVSPKDLP